MSKILITYGTRPFAQRVGHLLGEKYEVVYGSSEDFPEVLKQTNYKAIPVANTTTFAHELLKLCLDEGIDKLLPLGRSELQPLWEVRVLLAEYGVKLLVPHDLTGCLIVENPDKSLNLQVFSSGENMISKEQLDDHYFSGVGIRSDSGDELVLCLV
ncbi:hypothetical protein ORI89_00920 [Sphingobacterium sp. UT-1RO-CII-1]|uniref:hypothetical protein n=1 Tax=Sphingobacterium sp. UT-1RO-CII-1 TaxID=2995225 RepID=UPI00227D5B1D|nr:hypothetical protein [Sphingobacterium sp. UT-1RO-CII-1]MCY4778195.1 hypothetical protein [Sphingobacterium sp. UT-1RO-CII-1]